MRSRGHNIALFSITEFIYNNVKNTSIGYTFFKPKCGYHPCTFYEKNPNLCLKSKTTKELYFKFQELITVYQ